MRTIVGELPVEAGSIRLAPRDATIGWLPQVVPDPSETLLTYARRRTGVTAADAELEAASAAIAAGDEGSEDRYATALERWLALGAADLDERLPEVAARVGLDVAADRPLGTLSGGQAARACLVAVLLSQYDVLLLDEPTNDLDARGPHPRWPTSSAAHEGPILIASHDRTFLDAVDDRASSSSTSSSSASATTPAAGAASSSSAQLARAHAWEAYEGYAAERDSLLAQSRQRHDWADQGPAQRRPGQEPDKHIREKHKARADRQAAKGGRLERAADRLDAVEQPRKEWQLRYAITEGRPSADVVATLSDAVVERHGFRLGPVSLVVGRGDRIAVVGENGSGKTTLLGALLGDLPLASGRQSLGTRVAVGVIDQRRHLLDDDATVLDVVRRELGPDPKTVQGVAGRRRAHPAREVRRSGPSTSHAPRGACRWASAPAPSWPSSRAARSTSSCSTSRPTTSTSTPSSSSRPPWRPSGAPCSSSATTRACCDGIRLTHRWVVDARPRPRRDA